MKKDVQAVKTAEEQVIYDECYEMNRNKGFSKDLSARRARRKVEAHRNSGYDKQNMGTTPLARLL